MEESSFRKYEVLLKSIGLVATITTIFVGIHQFYVNQRNITNLEFALLAKNDSINTMNKLWNEKLDVYMEIGEAIGQILSRDSMDTEMIRSIADYKRIYYGKSVLVQDATINASMNFFRTQLMAYQEDLISKYQLNQIGIALLDSIKVSAWRKAPL